MSRSVVVENSALLRDDVELRMIDDLQELLYYLEESNFEDSIDKINKNGLRAKINARNICKYSKFDRSKIPLFVRLVSRLKSKSGILAHIMLIQNQKNYRKDFHLLNALGSYGLIDFFHEPIKDLYQDNTNLKQLKKAIKNDDIERLKIFFATPTFDINQILVLRNRNLISLFRLKLSLVELSARFASIKCFRFLYINGAKLMRENIHFDIMKLAIAGGNVEIIQILEQSNIHPGPECIECAACLHQREIFDWLIEQFPKSLNDVSLAEECFNSEFVHGILVLKKFNLSNGLENSGMFGLINLTKTLISRPYIERTNLNRIIGKIFFSACKFNDDEMVKFLLSEPVVNIEMIYVLIILLSSMASCIHVEKIILRLSNLFLMDHQYAPSKKIHLILNQ